MAKKQDKKISNKQGALLVTAHHGTAPRSSILTIDAEVFPISVINGRNPVFQYPDEFAVMDAMKVSQSAIFVTDKTNIVNALRNYFHKNTDKRFSMRKIDTRHSRIWRVKDKAVLGYGPRKAPNKNSKAAKKAAEDLAAAASAQQQSKQKAETT